MNNKRRKNLYTAIKAIEAYTEDRSLTKRLEEADLLVSAALAEEQDYFDVMPEGLQSGERGTTAEAAIDELTEAQNLISNLVNQTALIADVSDDIVEHITNAIEGVA
ncbi:MAG: hypothetical protein DI606_10515 [Sphingobium sp.]|uniref:hypothetical protein n=1 Tax=Sphingobium sp. TaxID=1912891 RepID=UPI000DB7729A|nr:hypothetical protein [Sphingobium sp.]PZU12105.1 MAG: hypothetical protein DI606_10515 [Sphingobium sp.]